MTPEHRLRHLRAGGLVERTHTCPHHGSYTVSQHSHQMAVLLMQLNPGYSRQLMEAVLTHDLAERHCGDIPRFAKTDDFRALEKNVQNQLGILIELDEDDQNWLEALDALELWAWCRDQAALGNRMVSHIEQRVYEWFLREWDRIPKPVMRVIKRYDADPLLPIGA